MYFMFMAHNFDNLFMLFSKLHTYDAIDCEFIVNI